jgi:hypothetical protein
VCAAAEADGEPTCPLCRVDILQTYRVFA